MRRLLVLACLAALCAAPLARAADLRSILQPVATDLLQMQADQNDPAKLTADAATVSAAVLVARPQAAGSDAKRADRQTAKVFLDNAACAADAVAKVGGKLSSPTPAQMKALTKAFACVTRAVAAAHKLGLR